MINRTRNVAILGASGQIGLALTDRFSKQPNYHISLFSRTPKLLSKRFLFPKSKIFYLPYEDFENGDHHIIVNCVGFGNPTSLKRAGSQIFGVTETFDNIILDYLIKNPDSKYVNISSGAVYNLNFNQPSDKDGYAISKIYLETKHRSYKDLNIVDLRLFSFFSRYIDIDSGFLLADIIKSIKRKNILEVSPDDIIRDYISPDDLLQIILLCSNKSCINDYFDVYSKSTIKKFELLEYFKKQYGLDYVVRSNSEKSPTGFKDVYFSKDKKAQSIGYYPTLSSIENIEIEAGKLL